MCDDHRHPVDDSLSAVPRVLGVTDLPGGAPSRRALLGGGAAALATIAGGAIRSSRPAAAAPMPAASRATNSRGEAWYRAATHIHGSFSEGDGSHTQHLDQAVKSGVDIVVRTDHDWRVLLRHYGGSFHFSGWRETTASGYWELVPRGSSGTLASGSSGTLVTDHSPADTSAGAGSLRLAVASTTSTPAMLAYEISSLNSNQDFNGTVMGRQLHLQVRLDSATSANSYPAVQVTLSRDPRYGLKTITYRLRGDLKSTPAPTVVGGAATVDYPMTRGVWGDFAPDILADIRRCWPDVIAEDNALNVVVLIGVGTAAEPLQALLSSFVLERDPDYDPAASLFTVLGQTGQLYPQLMLPFGLEHSVDHHFGQVGGTPFAYPYPETGPSTRSDLGDTVAFAQMKMIQDHGGVGSYNHPFGVTTSTPSGTLRDKTLARVMASVLRTTAYGADTLEVGYVHRGMDLAGHLELLDACSANRLYLTGVGVSDDHTGSDWTTQANRFVTIPWMGRRDEATLQSALRGGRVASGLLGNFDGALDLSINGKARMGQVYAANRASDDTLVVECYGAPRGSVLKVVAGPVDGAGTSFTRPSTIATLTATALTAGPVSIPFPTMPACYVRAELVNTKGVTIAFTNPLWRLPAGDTAPANRLVRG